MVSSFSFWFGVGSGGQSGQRCPQGTLAQPSPHGSCSPRAGGLRITPPSKRADNSWEGEGHRGQAPEAEKSQVREEDNCQLDRAMAPGPEPTTTPRSEEERSGPEKCGGGRNETASVRNMAVDRIMQLQGGERGWTVVEM